MRRLALALLAALAVPSTAGAAPAVEPTRVTSTTATITWRTPKPARSWIQYGGRAGYGLWTEATSGRLHRATLTGLSPSTTYPYKIVVQSGRRLDAFRETLRTPPPARDPAVATRGRALHVDGGPFLPVIQWSQCPEELDPSLGLGVNVFMGVCPESTPAAMLAAVVDRAYAVAPIEARGSLAGPALIGWHQMDEPDGYGFGPSTLPEPPRDRPTFLTVTAHFQSKAAPLPVGKDVYPEYFAKADVVGFDLYPLGKYCGSRYIGLADVFDAQCELNALAPGKPTFQWIETGPLDFECFGLGQAVTPEYLRAESWLALAGGATGLGYFTHAWPGGIWWKFYVSDAVRFAIGRATREAQSLAAALTAPETRVVAHAASAVRVGARRLNGAVYVIAVNAGPTPVVARFTAPAARTARRAAAFGENRWVRVVRGTISDRFEPLEVHVYVVPPPFDPSARVR